MGYDKRVQPIGVTRRQLIQSAFYGALAALQVPLAARAREPHGVPVFKAHPFPFGVASGDPRGDRVVLWTRLAVDPYDPSSLGDRVVPVRWEIAEDERFRTVIAAGEGKAVPDRGHSVHVEATGLAPATVYFYRFLAGGEESAVGRTKTAPAIGDASVAGLKLVFCSCAEYEDAYYHAYRHIADEQADAVLHLGDYIYETTFRSCADNERTRCLRNRFDAKTLDEYRLRYAEYKLDASLQLAHQSAPWILTWDDHEVANDYAGLHDERDSDPAEFIVRRTAAYRAYFENLPLAPARAPSPGGSLPLYRRFDFGTLARLHMLDQRQYRSNQACPSEAREGPRPGAGRVLRADTCPAFTDPTRTMLGTEQEAWLAQGLIGSPARWNLLAQGVPFAFIDQRRDKQAMEQDPSASHAYVFTDNWSGYPAARDRLIQLLARDDVHNPVVLSGDIHATFVNRILEDRDGKRIPVASEFVCPGVSSAAFDKFAEIAAAPENADTVLFYDGKHNGYGICELGPETSSFSMIGITGVDQPDPVQSERQVLARFEIRAGGAELRRTRS